MSRHHFCCKPIRSLVTTSLSCCDIISCFLPSCKLRLKLLIYLFSCHDIGIRSRQGCFFSYCNSYRDLKSMSRSFFLPILSQPHFLVTTVSTQFSFFFWSRPRKCVAIKWWSFLPCSCRSCSNLVRTCFNCSAHFDVAT